MLAKDVMTSPVVSIGPALPVLDIAELLVRHRIGGLPVLVNHQLAGIVTESDLLHRWEIGTADGSTPQSWWRRILVGSLLPEQYVKSHGARAQYVMTRTVVSVVESTPLSEIADMFDTRRIGRVPVLAGQQLVGIVTRADLLKTIAAKKNAPRRPHAISDAAIRDRLMAELAQQPWWNRSWSDVFVAAGVVEFRGMAQTETQKLAARVAAENIDGVVAVNDFRILSAELPMIM